MAKQGAIFKRLTTRTITFQLPLDPIRKNFVAKARKQAESTAGDLWDKHFSTQKKKDGRPPEYLRTGKKFIEVLQETEGKFPKYNRTIGYWKKKINEKWVGETGKPRNLDTIGKHIRPLIEKLPFHMLPTNEQGKRITDPYGFALDILRRNLVGLTAHVQSKSTKQLNWEDLLLCLEGRKHKRLLTSMKQDIETDPLLHLFLKVHSSLYALLDRIEKYPNSRHKHLSWLRQAIPEYFEA